MKKPTIIDLLLFVVIFIIAGGILQEVNADQGVIVTVPATSVIWVDSTGRIQKATSNSQGGFQPGDQLYIFDHNSNLIYQPTGE